jgi:hypothetical protein
MSSEVRPDVDCHRSILDNPDDKPTIDEPFGTRRIFDDVAGKYNNSWTSMRF